MIQFIKTESFIQRVWAVTLSLSTESLRLKLLSFDQQALIEEHTELGRQYNSFLIELESNLNSLPVANYEHFFNELEKLFVIPMTHLIVVNQQLKPLLSQHGLDYQKFAWDKMKRELEQSPHKQEVITDCVSLLLIATGGVSFYKKAFDDVQRQRRILLGPTKQKTPNPAVLAALVQKYVPSVSQSLPKQKNKKITYRQLALLHIYQRLEITRDESAEIARKHGFTSPTSGLQLYNAYNILSGGQSQRTGLEGNREIDCMIKDISFVITKLPLDKHKQAENELQTLTSKRNIPL